MVIDATLVAFNVDHEAPPAVEPPAEVPIVANRTMPWEAYGQMTDTELKVVWACVQTVPPRAKGNH